MAARAIATASPVRRHAFDRLVDALLFVTILCGSLVFIEPSPYEAVFALLLLVSLLGSVRFDRRVIPLFVLLMLWNVGSLFSLAPVAAEEDAVRFTAVSLYLSLNAILFACLYCDNPVRRLQILRTAYILSAAIASSAGIVAFFKIVPGADTLLLYDRVRGTFKDPNVFGPFLILPILLIVDAILNRRANLFYFAVLPVLLIGLFLSFSRGAWAHFIASLLIMFGFRFLTAPNAAERRKLVVLCSFALALLAGATAIAILLGLGGELFETRARLTQYYDVGEGGRFSGHIRGIPMLLESFNGFGPLQYRELMGQDAHQVYLNAFAGAGWIGGLAYILLVITTLLIGLRAVVVTTPWQHFLIPILATYIGVVLEGFIIDTDHWRHYFLLVGLIWGLSIATFHKRARRRPTLTAPR